MRNGPLSFSGGRPFGARLYSGALPGLLLLVVVPALTVWAPTLPCHSETSEGSAIPNWAPTHGVERSGPGPAYRAGSVKVDRAARSLSFTATLQREAFDSSLPPDHQYHAVVSRTGGASHQALFVTDADDEEVARMLRDLGAEDGGGVPMSAWNLRWLPLVNAPTARVKGSRVEVMVEWEDGDRPYTLAELLDDPGGEGVEMRFGGNEAHNHEWESGCILCLFSCPGGVISNSAYTIRDHQRGVTSFEGSDLLPDDGTEVTITLALVPD